MWLRGRPIVFYGPTGQVEQHDAPPAHKLQLEWVYVYYFHYMHLFTIFIHARVAAKTSPLRRTPPREIYASVDLPGGNSTLA